MAEKCEACERVIGAGSTMYCFNNHVICEKCHTSLLREDNGRASQFVKVSRPLPPDPSVATARRYFVEGLRLTRNDCVGIGFWAGLGIMMAGGVAALIWIILCGIMYRLGW